MFKVIGTIAVVAGSRVRLTVGEADPNKAYPCQTVRIVALPGNTGAVKIGDGTLVAATDVGVAETLVKPLSTGPVERAVFQANGPQNALSLADFYIDGTNTGDKVYVSIIGT